MPDAFRKQHGPTIRRLFAAAAVVTMLGGLAACGGSDDGEDTAASASKETSAESDGGGDSSGSDGAANDGAADDGGDGQGDAGGDSDESQAADPDADGAPGAPDGQGRQDDVFDRLPGSKKPKCVDVGNRRDVRSGGFVAGAWDDARRDFGVSRPDKKANEIRLYWIPLNADSLPGVTVVATRGDARVEKVQKEISDAEDWQFYTTLIKLDGPGTWTFKATSGDDSGCFRVTLGR